MTNNDQQSNEHALQELRDEIAAWGWSEFAILIAGDIEFFADLGAAGELSTEPVGL